MIKFKPLTPEDMERIKKEHDDRWYNRIPPKSRTGTCVICSGVVTEEFEKHRTTDRIGGHDPGYWKSSGLSCTECGIMYAKLPKDR